MEVIILDTAEEAEQFAASIILSKISKESHARLGLATGRTMEGVYSHFVDAHERGLNFSNIRTFNLDEYIGLSPANEASFYHYMDEHLFKKIDMPLENICIPHGRALDIEVEIKQFEEAITHAGGIDIQLLGIGNNGHIGFNEPPSSLSSPTRVVTLSEETRRQNAGAFGGNLGRVPTKAITMGLRTILRARQLLLVATGSHKANAIANAVEGPIRATVPASAIQLHPDPWIVLDREAAQNLEFIDYYKAQAGGSERVADQLQFIYQYMN